MKNRSFVSAVMMAIAVLFLGLVYLFSLRDQNSTIGYKNKQLVSIALTDFRPYPSSSNVFEKTISLPVNHDIPNPYDRSIQKILKDFNLSSSTFVLGQIAAQDQLKNQQGNFLTSDESFYQFLSKTFSDQVLNGDDDIVQHG